jgi:hypothetical protein
MVTARNYGKSGVAYTVTHDWLKKHGYYFDELHMNPNKADSELHLDWLIDDNQKNHEAAERAGIFSVLMARPWNDGLDCACGVVVKDLETFVDMVIEESRYAALAATTEEVRVVSSTGGAKGKKLARFDLIPPKALWEVAELYGKGAEKYDEWNWRKGYSYSLSIAALERHLSLYKQGIEYDEETGCHHLTSVVFHALGLLTFKDEHPEFDDRFIPSRSESLNGGGGTEGQPKAARPSEAPQNASQGASSVPVEDLRV